MISNKEMTFLEKELEDAEKMLGQLNNINRKERQRVLKNIQLHGCFIKGKWENILDLLEYRLTPLKNIPVSEQVITAYIQGNCYYKLGKYEEAFRELKFVESRGGNTKYVALAKDLIKKIPGNYTEKPKCIKHGIHKMHIFLAVNCFTVLLFVIIDYYFSHGSSVEEAYSRRYLCRESELTLFYQEEIANHKLVLLGEREKIAYCLFKEISNSNYKIIYSFRVNKKSDDEQTNQMKIELTENDKKFYREIEAEWKYGRL